MEMYFINSAACLAVLLLFYKLLLEKENMHVFKRFYLLFSVLISLIIPLITFTTYIEPTPASSSQFLITQETATELISIDYWNTIFLGIYVAGVLFFSIKFIRNLNLLLLKIRTNPKVKKNDVTNVLLSERTHPHTFFSYIFFNKQKYLRKEIPEDVTVHEEAHARQKHSLDVIFVELLQIILWFNPLIFLLKNYIKLNHEFLADRAVLQQGYKTAEYQQTLLSYSSGDLQSDLVNPINYSSIKKRFTVMKTQTSRKTILARGLLILPVLAILLYSFSTKEIIYKEISQKENSNEGIITGENFQDRATPEMIKEYTELVKYYNNLSKECPIIRQDDAVKIERVLSKMSPEQVKRSIKLKCKLLPALSKFEIKTIKESQNSQQKKATPEEVAEYNRLVKYYNEMPKDRRVVKQEHANKIMSILSRMSPEQRKNSEKINFDVPPPPPPAPAPDPSAPKVKEMMTPPPPPVVVTGHPAPPSPPLPPSKSGELEPVEVNGYPAPPPPPPSPIESVEEWIEQDAAFFYNGNAISGKEALEIVQKNNGKNMSVRVEEKNDKKTVWLSDKM